MPIYQLYGRTLASNFPLRALSPLTLDATPDLTFERLADPFWDQETWDQAQPIHPTLAAMGGMHVWQHGPQLCLREPGVVDFYIDAHQILCYLHQAAFAYIIELRLLGPVLSFWLEWHGTPNLHASGAVVNGSARLFLATNRGGKSSLVAALLARGAALLSDDIVPLHSDPQGQIWAEPGYPRMRFWPDALTHFLGDHTTPTDFSLVHPDYEKRWVPVGQGWGTMAAQAAPVSAIFLPTRDPTATTMTIEPVATHAAVMQLLAHSFSARRLPLGLQTQRLAFYTRLVEKVPVSVLRYPEGYDHLPAVISALLAERWS